MTNPTNQNIIWKRVNIMKLTNLIEEDFVNYRKPGMFLGFPYCSGKCNSPGKIVCQNEELRCMPEGDLIDISPDEIIERFYANKISECLILGGLEPFDSYPDVLNLLTKLSRHDPNYKWKNYRSYYPEVVIYTGYYPFEIKKQLIDIAWHIPSCINVIVKFGRYIPGDKPHFDSILGVDLASDNQFAMKITDEYTDFFDIAFGDD